MKIGNLILETPVALAPMAGITDSSFRRICKGFGADLVYTEMISAKALHYRNEKTEDLLFSEPEEKPLIVQIFGSEPEIMAEEAARIQHRFAAIDINLGCPAPKIVRNHEGSALLRNPDLVRQIVRQVSQAITVPVTVKIRKGCSADEDLAVPIACICEEAGAAAITVHGRTAAQLYSGKADWAVIKRVKDAVSIPVIGNGDVVNAESALRLLEETGCDGLMVGRASRGNPWIFREIRAAIEGKPIPDRPCQKEIAKMILRHGRMMIEEKGEYAGMQQMRAHLLWYWKGLPGAAQKKRSLQQVKSLSELEELVMA